MSKIFLDTNILIYMLDENDTEKQRLSREIVRAVVARDIPVISTQVLQEFYVTSTAKLDIDPLYTKNIMRTFENMEVVQIGPYLINEAIDTSILNRISFWDALILVAAERAKSEILYTEDLNSGQIIRGVRIENPLIH